VTLSQPPTDPGDLEDFPPLRPPPGKLARFWRLHRHFDAETGDLQGPFWFSAAEPSDRDGGRYDLPEPLGTNYWAGTAAGAWLEVFRDTLVVDMADLRARRLSSTRAPKHLRLANLLVKAARRFGITAEIHTTTDYETTRRWASAWHSAGFQGIWGTARHDPTLKMRTLTLFGESGEHPPFGWDWKVTTTKPAEDGDLLREMASWGYRLLGVPQDIDADEPSG
jgi:hypothetical protein